jgi:hypothetical protein
MIEVDAGFPGGNIIVEKIEGDTVFLRQDLRDTEGWWFYWYFRVRASAGRRLNFCFTNGNVIGVRGPAFSTDCGLTWAWLGSKSAGDASFSYRFPEGAGEVRFSFGMPYLEDSFRRSLLGLKGAENLHAGMLCKSRKGRVVESLKLGNPHAGHKVLLTCRHHCCEMMASYALEGMLGFLLHALAKDEWLRENVEVLCIPFVDKDGVEDGDQGKSRRPHDHNRDYSGGIYPEVKSLMDCVPHWACGHALTALDLHCPWIRGPREECIYFVGLPNGRIWEEVSALSALLEEMQSGPLPFKSEDNLPFGKEWNTDQNFSQGSSFSEWASNLPGIRLASAIEIPYANIRGSEVTPESARLFGGDLAAALCRYLKERPAQHF